MNKPTCLCHKEMAFLMDNKVAVIWQCPNCSRLLVQRKNSVGIVRIAEWYNKAVISDKEKQG
jgi:hypothetical protein